MRGHVARHALVGAAVGAAVGGVLALVVTHRGTYTDHSDDALAYVAFVPAGALVGTVAGVVVGLAGPH